MKSPRTIILAAASAALLTAAAQNDITTSLSNSVAEMGSLVDLKVQVVEPVESNSHIARDIALWPPQVEVRPDSSTSVKNIGNGLREVTVNYTIQSFDSGAYTLPPFRHIIGNDTTTSNTVTLKINPIDVSHLDDIHPMASVMRPGNRWYDFLPDWLTDYWYLILGAIVLIAAGIVSVLILTKRIKVPFIANKPVEPPYQQAKRLLGILRQEHLWEKGRSKEYYSNLTEILRRYISRRFNINALELTTSQLITKLKETPELQEQVPQIKAVLDTADFVKFAKMQPKPEVNTKAFDAVDEFIENTRPVETTNPDDPTKTQHKKTRQ